MSQKPDDMYRWGEICDDALRGSTDAERSNVGALLQHLGKALWCMTTFADKSFAAQRAIPHLAEALQIARNIRARAA